MKLRVLIKLSSILLLVACAKKDVSSQASDRTDEDKSVAHTDSNLYAEYDCTSFPSRDWLTSKHKSKAFLKMAIEKVNKLNIKGKYIGMSPEKAQCEILINTSNESIDILTLNQNTNIDLNLLSDFKIQGFSCSESKIRYDLMYENPNHHTTEYISLAFTPETKTLKEIFIVSNSLSLNTHRFECEKLQLVSF